MSTFLLLILVQISSGSYQTRMMQMPSMEVCLIEAATIEIPKEEGISYSLTCIAVRATMEHPV